MEGFRFRKLDSDNDDDLIVDNVPAAFVVLSTYGSNLDNVREIQGSDNGNAAAASLPPLRQRLPHTEQSSTG